MTRMAPEVPTIRAMRSSSTHPLPMLLQAPSPMAGYQEAPARAGQRDANSSFSPRTGSSTSHKGVSWVRSTGSAASVSSSQSLLCALNNPVPEAMETLQAGAPNHLRKRYSPMDIQCSTWAKRPGSFRASQHSLAGR